MRLNRRQFLGGSALSTVLALGGCGGDSSGSGSLGVTPTPTATPAPPPATTPTPPPAPAPSPDPTPPPAPTPSPVAAPGSRGAVIVQAGDSIGYGLGGGGFVAINELGFPSTVDVSNVSSSGRQMSQSYEHRETELFIHYDATRPSILLIQLGTNDLGFDVSARNLYDLVARPFVAAARAAGFYVLLNTILPRADSTWSDGREAQRLLYNSLVRANGAQADLVNDVAADPAIGDAVNPATSPLFVDALHPSYLGQQRLAVIHAAALSAFLTLGPRATGLG